MLLSQGHFDVTTAEFFCVVQRSPCLEIIISSFLYRRRANSEIFNGIMIQCQDNCHDHGTLPSLSIHKHQHEIECVFDTRQNIFFCDAYEQIWKQKQRATKLVPGCQEKLNTTTVLATRNTQILGFSDRPESRIFFPASVFRVLSYLFEHRNTMLLVTQCQIQT